VDARQYQGVTRNEHSAKRAEYSEAQRTTVFATGEESPSNTLRPRTEADVQIPCGGPAPAVSGHWDPSEFLPGLLSERGTLQRLQVNLLKVPQVSRAGLSLILNPSVIKLSGTVRPIGVRVSESGRRWLRFILKISFIIGA
jgi:hypothetical protein